MPNTNYTYRDRYYVGDIAPKEEGVMWNNQNNNQVQIFRNNAWVTPGLSAPVFTNGASFTTPAASATGHIELGTGAVPTTATSTSGLLQIAALPGTPVGQSATPDTGTVFLTFDRIHRSIAVKIAGSWLQTPSMELY